MKTLLTILFSLSSILLVRAQEQNIETKSITIDNFINYVVNHTTKVSDTVASQNLTFLFETHNSFFNTEDKTVLKHGIKFLSEKLNSKDYITIVCYGRQNGIILQNTQASNIKLLLSSIESPNIRPDDNIADGIELAYQLAKESYLEEGQNYVVLVRNPNRKPPVNTQNFTATQPKTKGGGNAVVLTAIALLPEIIKVIKD
jgi:hypothetical protein